MFLRISMKRTILWLQRVSKQQLWFLSPSAFLLLFGLIIYSIYLTNIFNTLRTVTASVDEGTKQSQHQRSQQGIPMAEDASFPDVFIFRRTRRTGSLSMLEALVHVLRDKGYVPLYYNQDRMSYAVRAENMRSNPRRLLILQHNRVTRRHTRGRKAVIADTVYDGFQQITGFCRFFMKVEGCKEGMLRCLQSENARAQKSYRWAGDLNEADDTYIDLPLSSDHPALSTTVFRTVYPNTLLEVQKVTAAGSTCEETPELQAVYEKHFFRYERQIEVLRSRLLALTGYPIRAADGANTTLADMMDAAEEIEKQRYTFGKYSSKRKAGDAKEELKQAGVEWTRSVSGKLQMTYRGWAVR